MCLSYLAKHIRYRQETQMDKLLTMAKKGTSICVYLYHVLLVCIRMYTCGVTHREHEYSNMILHVNFHQMDTFPSIYRRLGAKGSYLPL